MGNLGDMMSMIPGLAGKMKGGMPEINEKQLLRTKAIIQSMTPKERRNPDIIKASRRKRIAAGSGTSIQEVNQLLKQFEVVKNMMHRVQKGGMRGLRGLF
jgi:signal recognition particle subunit SRP54